MFDIYIIIAQLISTVQWLNFSNKILNMSRVFYLFIKLEISNQVIGNLENNKETSIFRDTLHWRTRKNLKKLLIFNKNQWASRKNIETLFKPNERLFDLTHKTSIKSLCVLPPFFIENSKKMDCPEKKGFL